MNLKGVLVKNSGFRCTQERLADILAEFPVDIRGSRVEAHMGLGKRIYIRPIMGGRIDSLKINGVYVELLEGRPAILIYKSQKYEISPR